MRIQCASSCPYCIVWNDFMRAHWLQVATPPHSYHCALVRSVLQPVFVLLFEMNWCRTQCVAWRSMLTVGSRHTCAYQSFLVLTCNVQLCDPDQSPLDWIQIGWMYFSVDAFNPDSIQFNVHVLDVQCGRTCFCCIYFSAASLQKI